MATDDIPAVPPRSAERRHGFDRRMRDRQIPDTAERRSGSDRRRAFMIPLFVKFITLSTCVSVVVVASISFSMLRQQKIHFRELLIAQGESLARITAEHAPDKLLTDQDLILFQLVRDLAADPEVIYASIADAGKRIKASSLSGGVGAQYSRPEGTRSLGTGADVQVFSFPHERGEALYFERAITYQDIPVGTVALAISQERIDRHIQAARRFTYVFMAVILILGGMLSMLLGLYFTRPIRRLKEGTQALRAGDFDYRVEVRRNDELGELALAFNQMAQGLRERNLMRRSLELAMEVQRSLLPQGDPRVEGLDIAGKSVYCDETGGDYYDFLLATGRDGHPVGLLLGDVSGHGISSALLMATARALIRQRALLPGDLAQMVTDVNRLLVQDVLESGSFMTLFFMDIDVRRQSLRWVRAGHDPAILFDPATDRFEYLRGDGIPLGVTDDWQFTESRKENLREGQIIVIGTDGIWEAVNWEGTMFGKDPMHAIIRANHGGSARDILDAVITALDQHRQGLQLQDDVTLLVVKIGPTPTTTRSAGDRIRSHEPSSDDPNRPVPVAIPPAPRGGGRLADADDRLPPAPAGRGDPAALR
jgi:serine phosphatase RsbU (regulator of sigma subunit)